MDDESLRRLAIQENSINYLVRYLLQRLRSGTVNLKDVDLAISDFVEPYDHNDIRAIPANSTWAKSTNIDFDLFIALEKEIGLLEGVYFNLYVKQERGDRRCRYTLKRIAKILARWFQGYQRETLEWSLNEAQKVDGEDTSGTFSYSLKEWIDGVPAWQKRRQAVIDAVTITNEKRDLLEKQILTFSHDLGYLKKKSSSKTKKSKRPKVRTRHFLIFLPKWALNGAPAMSIFQTTKGMSRSSRYTETSTRGSWATPSQLNKFRKEFFENLTESGLFHDCVTYKKMWPNGMIRIRWHH